MSTPVSFLEKLASAATEAEVVEVVRTYTSRLRPEELATLQPECRPGRIRDGEDIADIAISLTKCRMAGTENVLLNEMENFFAHACARISELEPGGAVCGMRDGGDDGDQAPA